ncbi:hypothetical protein CFIMG_006983RA [Ceratocystis fimbriata CBS 114723]|uniref:Uncharacterized protein n=1 Tax=Ceratocystis fimbriata CBS 114723 TaxID=1035309 RepID=A0A2C5WFD4_9PEZI|nr:hypothetical protein CFIMG_006983RA [Ceratocystis fimbriata CBS 114723]
MFSYYTVEKTNNGYQYVRQRRHMATSPSNSVYNMESPHSPPFSYAALERSDSDSENPRSSRYSQHMSEHEPSQSQEVRDQRCRHKYRSGKDTQTQDDSHKRRGSSHKGGNSSSRQFSQSYSYKCDGSYDSKQRTPTSENDKLHRRIASLSREVQDLQSKLAACADSSLAASSELRHYKKDAVPRLREKITALTTEKKVTTSLAAAEAELDKLRHNGRREYEKRKKAQSEIARLRGEVNAWETKYEALYQARSAEKHKLQQEIEELQEKVQDCGGRIQSYVDRLNLYEPLLKREGYLRDG